jgi:hypothetical protein
MNQIQPTNGPSTINKGVSQPNSLQQAEELEVKLELRRFSKT